MKQKIVSFSLLLLIGYSGDCGPDGRSTGSLDETHDKPNIIFLLTDDQRWDSFGFAGNEYIKTPHCDKLAKEGVVFKNAYHVAPICQPSRASIMLGQFLITHRSGFDKPGIFSVSHQEFDNSFPVLLRESGYYTGMVGKFGFAVSENKIMNVAPYKMPKERDHTTQLWLQDEYMPKDRYDEWHGFPGQGSYNVQGKHGTEYRGDQSIAFIQNAAKQNKPFMLQVCFKAPHGPFQPAQEFLDLYKDVDIPRYNNDNSDAHKKLPEVVKSLYRGRDGIKENDKFQNKIKRYFALITGVDHVAGRIVKELEKLGLSDNTIIIFSSDNGYFLGSKGLDGKDLLYEESVRSPLFIYDPRLPGSKRGTTIDGLVSMIDIAPSILDYAGIKAPPSMQGSSFLPMINEGKEKIHEAVFGENNFTNFLPLKSEVSIEKKAEHKTVRSRFVRTEKFKYIRYYECTPVVEELWEISKDPQECIDLSDNPYYKDKLEEMRNRLDDFVRLYAK